MTALKFLCTCKISFVGAVIFFGTARGFAAIPFFEHKQDKPGEGNLTQVARDQQRYHQVENEEGDNRSSAVA